MLRKAAHREDFCQRGSQSLLTKYKRTSYSLLQYVISRYGLNKLHLLSHILSTFLKTCLPVVIIFTIAVADLSSECLLHMYRSICVHVFAHECECTLNVVHACDT